MRLIVGLGNPGQSYDHNRHNIGFMAVDAIARRHNFSPFRPRFKGYVSEGSLGGQKLLLLKPQTYMNKSGDCVGQAMRFYKIPSENISVIYDELDLAPFKIKVKTGGGAAGHNGIRSLSQHIGPSFERIRLGIGHPGDKSLVHNYVLGDFAKSEQRDLIELLDAVADTIEWIARGDGPRFMTELARVRSGNSQSNQKIISPALKSFDKKTNLSPVEQKVTIDASRTAAEITGKKPRSMAEALKTLFSAGRPDSENKD